MLSVLGKSAGGIDEINRDTASGFTEADHAAVIVPDAGEDSGQCDGDSETRRGQE